jgi:hypothetical protein
MACGRQCCEFPYFFTPKEIIDCQIQLPVSLPLRRLPRNYRRIDEDGLGLRLGGEIEQENLLLIIEQFLQGRLDQILRRKIDTEGIDILLIFVELKM